MCSKPAKVLCLFTRTQTLNVQGAQQDKIKKNIVLLFEQSLILNDDQESEVVTDVTTTDDQENEVVIDEEETATVQPNSKTDMSEAESDDEHIQSSSARENVHSCCSCQQNSNIIIDLSKRVTNLESSLLNRSSPSYEELLEKVRMLQEERDSLVTAIRILREDITRPNYHQEEQKICVEDDREWTEVVRRKQKLANIKSNDNSESKNSKPQSNHRQKNHKDRLTIIGDSMIKFVRGEKLSRAYNVKSIPIPGATIDDARDLIKPVMKRNPQKLIIHVGTNNIKAERPKQVSQKMRNLVESVQQDHSSAEIGVSSIIHCVDDPSVNSKIDKVNSDIEKLCESKKTFFLSTMPISVLSNA